MTTERHLAKLANSVMAYDYGFGMAPALVPTPVSMPAPMPATYRRDPFEADFGQDPGFYAPQAPQAPPTTAYAHQTIPLHPGVPHQTITVRTPPQKSMLLEFVFQTLAVVVGGYAVQRFIVPRMPHHRSALAD